MSSQPTSTATVSSMAGRPNREEKRAASSRTAVPATAFRR